MATRIELNLPPRLLESARATQAANQRQLLNREQQTRDAREVRRQLRQAEAQGRTVRGREQERRGNGVPQFPLSAGDRLPRRGGIMLSTTKVAVALIEDEKIFYPGETNYNNWILYSGDGSKSAKIVIPDGVQTGSLPVYTPPGQEPPVKNGSYSFSYSNEFLIVFPAGGDGIVIANNYVTYRTNIAWRYTQAPNGSWLYSETVTTGPTGDGGSASYIATKRTIRQVGPTPAVLDNWLGEAIQRSFDFGWEEGSLEDDLDPLVQGLSIGLGERNGKIVQSYTNSTTRFGQMWLGTPATAAGILGNQPDRWSPSWIDFRQSETDPTIYQGYRTSELDPVRHYPISTQPGNPVNGLVVPFLKYKFNDGRVTTPLVAWDWGKPALCRQLLLQLGFSPADLTP